jgi:hypothetical protein
VEIKDLSPFYSNNTNNTEVKNQTTTLKTILEEKMKELTKLITITNGPKRDYDKISKIDPVPYYDTTYGSKLKKIEDLTEEIHDIRLKLGMKRMNRLDIDVQKNKGYLITESFKNGNKFKGVNDIYEKRFDIINEYMNSISNGLNIDFSSNTIKEKKDEDYSDFLSKQEENTSKSNDYFSSSKSNDDFLSNQSPSSPFDTNTSLTKKDDNLDSDSNKTIDSLEDTGKNKEKKSDPLLDGIGGEEEGRERKKIF